MAHKRSISKRNGEPVVITQTLHILVKSACRLKDLGMQQCYGPMLWFWQKRCNATFLDNDANCEVMIRHHYPVMRNDSVLNSNNWLYLVSPCNDLADLKYRLSLVTIVNDVWQSFLNFRLIASRILNNVLKISCPRNNLN